MSDIDQIVNKLEQSIRKTEQELYEVSANMPKGSASSETIKRGLSYEKYTLIAIPLLVLLALYFIKPKFIRKEPKQKDISYSKFLGYGAFITVVLYAILFLVVKYGYINF